MTDTHSRIQAAAATNARLLKTLSETDYAVSALQQNTSYINTLKKQTAQEELKLKTATQKVGKEYKEHKTYRDSHMRRLAYKLGGKKEKFEAEASKEEREWLEAVQEELHCKKALEQLRANMADAVKTNADLSAVAQVHGAAKGELDVLYRSIFEGPTPSVPGEDEKETAVNQAVEAFNEVQFSLSTEKQARSILLDADKFLNLARGDIADALSAATMDAWGVGGSFADMSKMSALSKAQNHISQVEMLMNQAMRVQPAVQGIGAMDVPEMRFMTDMVFDNVFSDMNARDRIQDSQRLLEIAKGKLTRELGAADGRIARVGEELGRKQGELDVRRGELQDVRRAAFDGVAGGSAPSVGSGVERAPPSYDAEPPQYSA